MLDASMRRPDESFADHLTGPDGMSTGMNDRTTRPWLLALTRIGWWLTTTLSLVVFVPSILQLYTDTKTTCASQLTCAPDQLTPQEAHSLQSIGWLPGTYANFTLILALFSMLAWLSIGALIAWRKWADVMALLISAQAVTQSVSQVTPVETFHVSIWFAPATVLSIISSLLLFLAFALFPQGRFAPRWLRWVAILYFFYAIASALPYEMLPSVIAAPFSSAANVIWFTFMGALIVGQVYRYRYVSTAAERQQTKWLVFAFCAIIVLQFAIALPQVFIASLSQDGSLYSLSLDAAGTIILLIGPICIAIAILRYRLYDIDILIKRTLVYGSLTAILAALYFALVIGAQTLTRHFIGQSAPQSPIVIVLSTLLIAALFQPLRHRLQRTIDRRFDRSRYDAAKTLAAFSASLRSEVNLQQLNERLLGVVEETMHPTQVSLWLRPAPERATPRE